MTRRARTITEGMLAAEALRIMEENRISALVVVGDRGEPVGVVSLLGLLQAGIA